MPPTLEELREQRNDAATQADQIATRDDPTSDDLDRADVLLNTVEDLDKRILVLEKNDRVKERLAEPRPDPKLPPAGDPDRERSDKAYDKAFRSWIRGGRDALESRQLEILQKGHVDLTAEQRALGTGGSAGGYTIPAGFLAKITETMKLFGGMRQVANVISTDSGNSLPWPTNNDTGNVGVILAENNAMAEQDVTFGQKTLGAFMYSSKMIRVSYQLLQDSAFDLESFLARKLGERIGRIQNTHFTTGAGTTLPFGVLTGATSGVTTAAPTAITYGEIVDLIHSVDPAYRSSGQARFMMADSTLALIRKLADSTNRPLWQPDVQAGVPGTILGYPITINQDMPAATATLVPIAFGDFNAGYVIRDVSGIQVRRLEERYAEYLQVAFFAYARADGVADDTAAYRVMTMHA